MTEVLRVAAEMEGYKALSNAATNKATELVKQSVMKHAEEGGCNQCTEGGPESHTCVMQEIESGETKDSQDATLLHNAIDVKSLKRGLGAECKNIWTGAGTECQDGSCSSLKDDATDTATQAGSGQGSGHGREMEETRTAELRLEAMRQLEEADTDGVFGWIAQHNNLRAQKCGNLTSGCKIRNG